MVQWRIKQKEANEAMQAELVTLRARLTTVRNLP
jgi:hypothetical protein